MDTILDNKLPLGLEKLMVWIMRENRVQSWRYSGENTLTLSIRFTNIDPISSTPLQPSTVHGLDYDTRSGMRDCSYRSKPPSSVYRDQHRSQAWLNRKQYDSEINSNVRHSNVYHTLSSDTGFCETYQTLVSDNVCDSDINKRDLTEINKTCFNEDTRRDNTRDICCQTDATVSTSIVQTECQIIPVRTIAIQQPQTKKHGIQTVNISKHTREIQTVPQIKYAKYSQTELNDVHIKHQACMTTSRSDQDKTTATESPTTRHCQTYKVQMHSKKVGMKHIEKDVQTSFKDIDFDTNTSSNTTNMDNNECAHDESTDTPYTAELATSAKYIDISATPEKSHSDEAYHVDEDDERKQREMKALEAMVTQTNAMIEDMYKKWESEKSTGD